MINLRIGVGFVIRNLTQFEWSDFQEQAQKMADTCVFHALPTDYERRDAYHFGHKDKAIVGFIRKEDECVEFLFIQPEMFCIDKAQEPPR